MISAQEAFDMYILPLKERLMDTEKPTKKDYETYIMKVEGLFLGIIIGMDVNSENVKRLLKIIKKLQ